MITAIAAIAIINISYALYVSHQAESAYVNSPKELRDQIKLRSMSMAVNQLYLMVCIGLNLIILLSALAIFKLNEDSAVIILVLDVIFSQIITTLSIDCTRRRLEREFISRGD